jgi:ubiquinone/menaquinone biosynthesis C-methylase UbiE
MGFYQDHVVPCLVHPSMRQARLAECGRRVVAEAQGRVLEIGVGSGINLPLYPQQVKTRGRDRSMVETLVHGDQSARASAPSVELLRGSAEALPLEAQSVDTFVTTWTLCSIPDVRPALGEVRRVLQPDGRLLFVEHGLGSEPKVRWWQHRLTPVGNDSLAGVILTAPSTS